MASSEHDDLVSLLRSQPMSETPSVDALRDQFEQLARMFPEEPDVAIEETTLAGRPAVWHAAANASPDRIILYLHGGGYVIGSPRTHRSLMCRLSRAAGARVVGLDYRLAPEAPFPSAVDDATSGWKALMDEGVAPARAAIAGDSAGGGLTLATLLALREQRAPLPAAAYCLSPWVDLEALGESMETRRDVDPLVQKEPLLQMAALYLNGQDARQPLAAPLHGDLRGLPPILVQVGDAETLLDDSTRLAAKIEAGGGEVELDVWPEMIHVWQVFASILPEGEEALEKAGKWLEARWG